jgi:hypothetical protein
MSCDLHLLKPEAFTMTLTRGSSIIPKDKIRYIAKIAAQVISASFRTRVTKELEHVPK